MEEKDLQNLESVFALARQASVSNEQTLQDLILYKADLFKRIKELIEKEKNNEVDK
jgi:hypothetical protein